MQVLSLALLQATRAYLHPENEVQDALRKAGFRVTRKEMTATRYELCLAISCAWGMYATCHGTDTW